MARATLKKKLLHDQHSCTDAKARAANFDWIEVWYQRIRIHVSLGYVSPETFEATERVG
jgi:putative transposase